MVLLLLNFTDKQFTQCLLFCNRELLFLLMATFLHLSSSDVMWQWWNISDQTSSANKTGVCFLY